MDLLLQKDFVFHPEDGRTNLCLELDTPRDYDRLEFSYSYGPKRVTDPDLIAQQVEKGFVRCKWAGRERLPLDMEECNVLFNFVTLSLDYEGKYVGCAHRHDPEQVIVISEQESTRGFFRQKAAKGHWRIVLNIQAVVETSEIEYHLTVHGCDNPTYQYRPFELHTHTRNSDGQFTVPELCRAVKAYGYAGMALTDHNTESGHAELTESLQASTVPVIPGIEWTTFFGHMLVLGCPEYVDWRFALPEDIDTYIQKIRDAGGIVGIAHPYEVGAPMCGGCHWEFKVQNWENVSYIEVWSQEEPMLRTKNRMALEWWTELLNQGHHLAISAGRDWHAPDTKPHVLTATYLGLPGGEVRPEYAIAALREGRTYLTLGPTMTVKACQEGKEYGLGETMQPGACQVTVSVGETERREHWERWGIQVREIRIVHHNGVESRTYRGDPVTIPVEDDLWMRVELYGDQCGRTEQLLAVSSPIYFR